MLNRMPVTERARGSVCNVTRRTFSALLSCSIGGGGAAERSLDLRGGEVPYAWSECRVRRREGCAARLRRRPETPHASHETTIKSAHTLHH